MRRLLITTLLALASVAGFAGAAPVQAAPPGPQCGAVVPCGGPAEKVQEIIRTCQRAYCQFP